uniref:Uncharacterized protein n=1 Tax=Glossina pallidipes TaxID=7398 RepID=A0A1B0AI71_GLOPL
MDGHMHHISFFATRPSITSTIRSLAASVCNTNAIASIPAQSVTITKAPIVNVPKSATATVAKPVTIAAAPKPAATMSTVKTQKTSSPAKSQPQAPPEANKSKSPTFAKQPPCTKPKTQLPTPPPPPLPPPNEIKAEPPPLTSKPKCKPTASTTASSVRRKGFFRLGFIPRNILKLSLFYITASMVVDLTSQK